MIKINKDWIVETRTRHPLESKPSRLEVVHRAWRDPDFQPQGFKKSEATFIHYPSLPNFIPIVCYRGRVFSEGNYPIERFYKAVNHVLKYRETANLYMNNPGNNRTLQYATRVVDYGIHWGCRRFTWKQLETIRDAVKWHMEN